MQKFILLCLKIKKLWQFAYFAIFGGLLAGPPNDQNHFFFAFFSYRLIFRGQKSKKITKKKKVIFGPKTASEALSKAEGALNITFFTATGDINVKILHISVWVSIH